MTRRAGLYLRISEDRTGEGLAVDRQRQDGAALIARRGWHLVDEYIDNDTSAAGKRRRPRFDALLADVEAGAVDTIVALSMDRLSRNRRDDLRIVETCQRHQAHIALVKGSDIDMTTAAGRLIGDLLGGVARHEIEVKSERHRRQVQQAAAAGLPGGGPRAFGYRKGGMEVEPGEAETVEQLYRRFLAGAGLSELTAWLNEQGLTTPKGHRWRVSSTKVVLANPRNAGLRGLRPIVDEASGRRAQYHDIIGPGKWPPIVDEATWRATMALLRDPTRPGHNRHPGGNRPKRLLSGIAVCSVCELHMISGMTGPGVRTYRCSSREHLNRNALHLETFVQQVMMSRLRRPDAIDLLSPAPQGPDLAALQNEALTLRALWAGLPVDYADGLLDREQLRIAGDRLRAQLADVESRVAAAGRADVVAPLVLADDEAAAWRVWAGYPMSTRRSAVAQLLRIHVHRGRRGRPSATAPFDPATVTVTWRQ